MDYMIGAGAILESGERGTITPATLHAQVDPLLGQGVRAAAVDFEATTAAGLKRLLIVAEGFDAARFRDGVSEKLRARRDCTLADVLLTLARATGAPEVHLFAHWLPDEATCAQLSTAGIEVIAHPLESISAASVVTGQRYMRWRAA